MGESKQCLPDRTDGGWESPNIVLNVIRPLMPVHTNGIGILVSDCPRSQELREMAPSAWGSRDAGVDWFLPAGHLRPVRI